MKTGLTWAAVIIAVLFFVVFLPWIDWHYAFDPSIDHDRLSAFFFGLQAIGSLLTTGAIIAAFAQVKEARNQLRDNRDWNRMSFALTFLPSVETFFMWEQELEASFVKLISRNEPLSANEIKELNDPNNSKIHLLLKSYMNALEAYSLAINSGLANEETAKRIYNYKLIRHFVELEPYIRHQRARCHDDGLFCEMEDVYSRWVKDFQKPADKYGNG